MSETPTDKVKRDTGDVGSKTVRILGDSWKIREIIQLVLLVGTALGFGVKAIGDTQFGATAAQQQQVIEKVDGVVEKIDRVDEKVGEVKHQVELQGKDLEALKVQQNGQADAIRKLQADVDELKKRE
ncbi:MAG: hypothetical protein ICCCNLDF_02808 [Planctomycetes bacterium]|nr:hypothetical protein [Planctomycetota bacterium]